MLCWLLGHTIPAARAISARAQTLCLCSSAMISPTSYASPTPARAGRPTIHEHLRAVGRQLPAHEHAALRLLALLERQVAALPASQQTFGLIHYDFELDNLIWDDQRVGIVDFDDCAGYWFVADIAF